MFKELVEYISNWEYAKDILMVKAIPVKDVNKKAVYRIIGDIALVVALMLDNTENCMVTASVTKVLAKEWSKSEEEIFAMAFNGTPQPKIISPENFSAQELITCDISEYDFADAFICMTNDACQNGATSIFLPGVADSICNGLNSSKIRITFTSRHEAMIHPETFSAEDLKLCVADTMRAEGTEGDFLSASVYEYDIFRKEFRVIA